MHVNFNFDPLKLYVEESEETIQLPDILATHTYICGHVETVSPRNGTYIKSFKERIIHCSKEPYPDEYLDQNADKNIFGIEPMTTKSNKEGRFCFNVTNGMWRMTSETIKAERSSGINWDYNN